MRRIRGHRPASDDERTVEALPEEPTVSVQVDVRRAFEEQDAIPPRAHEDRTLSVHEDRTLPGHEDRTLPGHDRTLPGHDVRALGGVPPEPTSAGAAQADAPMRPRANTLPIVPSYDAPRTFDTPSGEHASPESGPRELSMRTPFGDAEPIAHDPHAAGAQRRRMQRIVLVVLSGCALLCIAAVGRQLVWPDTRTDARPTASAAQTPSALATETAPATAAPIATPKSTPTPTSTPTPGSAPTATETAPAPPSATAPPPLATAPTEPPRRAEPRAAVHAKPVAPVVPPRPTSRGTIVRDSPF